MQELNTLKDDLKPARSQLAPSILNYGVDKVAEIFMEGEILSFIAGMRILIQVTTLQVEIGGESYHYVTRSEATDEDDSDSSKSADADNAVPTTQSRATGNVTARSPSASILPSNPETTAEREHIEADIAMEDKIAGEDDDVDYEGDTSGSECESADESEWFQMITTTTRVRWSQMTTTTLSDRNFWFITTSITQMLTGAPHSRCTTCFDLTTYGGRYFAWITLQRRQGLGWLNM